MNFKEFNRLATKAGFSANIDNELLEQGGIYELDYISKTNFSKITVSLETDYEEKLTDNTTISDIVFSDVFENYTEERIDDALQVFLSNRDTTFGDYSNLDCTKNCLLMVSKQTNFLQQYFINVGKLLKYINNTFASMFEVFHFNLNGVDTLFTDQNEGHKFILYYEDAFLYKPHRVVILYNPFSQKAFITYGKTYEMNKEIELKDLDIDKFVAFLSDSYQESVKQDTASLPMTSEEFIEILKTKSFYDLKELEQYLYKEDVSWKIPHKVYEAKTFYNAYTGKTRYTCIDGKIVEIEGVISIFNDSKEKFGMGKYKYEIIN